MNAVKTFLRTGNNAQLQPFKSLQIRASGATYQFITDPILLRRFADADVLSDGLYRAIQGGSE
jgi:hypothetical protein